MTKLFGLPAHALLVHAPIALTPLVVVFCAAVIFLPSWRAKLGVWAIVASGALMVAMFLAKQSGESFRDAMIDAGNISARVIKRHAELGDTTFLISVLFFVAVVAAIVLARRGMSATVVRALGGLTVVLGVLALIWTIRTGHEGANVVWDGVLP